VVKLFLIMLLVCLAANGLLFTEAESQTCPGPNMTQEWIECHNAVVQACALVPRDESEACKEAALRRYFAKRQRPGVVPVKRMAVPAEPPHKGKLLDLQRGALHLSSARWTVLRPHEARSVLHQPR
jgi:hypothetical protein